MSQEENNQNQEINQELANQQLQEQQNQNGLQDQAENQGSQFQENGEQQQQNENQDDFEEIEVEEPLNEEEIAEAKQKAIEANEDPENIKLTKTVLKKVQKQQNQDAQSNDGQNLSQQNSQKQGNLNISQILEWVKEKIDYQLNVFDEDIMWNETIQNATKEFLTNQDIQKIFFWANKDGFQYSFTEPPQLNEKSYDTEFIYFIKLQPEIPIDDSNYEENIQYHKVKSNYIQSLLKMLDDYYNPQIYSDKSWPDNVKKEFIAQMDKLMASFTEASQEGFTKLYIPKEDLQDHMKATSDKDLLQRLEVILITWYRQIKDVVNSQDNQTDSENAGPLDEITYWRNRKENLSYIQEQLQNPGLQKILQILKLVSSSYVDNFQTLTNNINKSTEEAQNNLDFLKSLQQPCKQLEIATPKEIPALLPQLLNRVRMIWEYSTYYNVSERISGLLHKISNEIIKRCKAKININDMLNDDVERCMQDLKDSIECGGQWRAIYQKTEKLIEKNKKKTDRKWNVSNNSIFAQIDAFVQRCTELTEICEGQLQFAGKGSNSKIPCFGGSRGSEIENILEEIKISFKKHLDKIRDTEKDKILDVKDSNWHDMFNSFKTGLKDLDVMYQNIINFAFDQVSTVQRGCEMLEAFDYLAKRESIKAAVSKKAVEVLQLFQNELQQAKQEFDGIKKDKNLALNIPLQHGKYSGYALWVRALIDRIQRQKESIDRLFFVSEEKKRAAYDLYDQLFQEFKSYIQTQKMKEWKESKEMRELEEAQNSVGLGPKCLDKAILVKQHDSKEEEDFLLLTSNFDKNLDKLITEVIAWKKLTHMGVVIPNVYDEFITNHKEQLRVLKEYVMLVVRDQNRIIKFMNELENYFYFDLKERQQAKMLHKQDPKNHPKKSYSLFKGHIQKINTNIEHGQKKIKWSSKGIIEGFVRDCRKACAELYNILLMFKENTEKIDQKCLEISQKILIKNDKKSSIELHKYEEIQEKHRNEMKNKLKNSYEEIKNVLEDTYEPFMVQARGTTKKPNYGRVVQATWFDYLQIRDRKIEEALKKSLKNSLLDLHKVIGDNKITPSPILKIFLEMETENMDLKYVPSDQEIKKKIIETISQMSNIFKDFQKFEVVMYEIRKVKLEERRILQEKETKNNPSYSNKNKDDLTMNIEQPACYGTEAQFYQTSIAHEKEIKRFTESIPGNLESWCKQMVNSHLNGHSFRKLTVNSQNNGSNVMQGLLKRNGSDIQYIKEYMNFIEQQQLDVLRHKSTEEKFCFLIDNTNIKQKFEKHLQEQQQRFLQQLQKNTVSELNDLYNYFESRENALKPLPINNQQLDENKKILDECVENLKNTENKIKPIQDKFKVLQEYQVQFKEEITTKKDKMQEEFDKFAETLEEIKTRNQTVWDNLKSDTVKKLEEFQREVSDNKVQFEANAPKQVGQLSNERAFELLNEYQSNIENLKQKEQEMRFGIDLFDIPYDKSQEVIDVESEIENLKKVWNLKTEWDIYWDKVKLQNFANFDAEALDEEADDFISEINEFNKEMKKWEVVNSIKISIESFRNTLPIIAMLRNECMRDRHWQQLQTNFGQVLQYNSEDFSLNDLFGVNLLSQQDYVNTVFETAREQFKIESALSSIESKWRKLDLVMAEHKPNTYKVMKIDEIQTTLEDHMALLSAQKTTLYYDHFRDEIEKWEQTLQNITETLENLLQVQRQWIYLEAIFAAQANGDNDQKKQLMGDISKFEKIEKQLQGYMREMNQNRNAQYNLDRPGFLKDLIEISKKLDESKKILFQLLERTRKEFPRFYLLSNDDLFEILGNQKNPDKINKHMLKCFQGIKKLEFNQLPPQIVGGKKQGDNYEISTIMSPDGEKVKLFKKVAIDRKIIQNWLQEVDNQMKESLSRILVETKGAMKKKTETQQRWVNEWVQRFPGQLLIVASQINWTHDCTKVLENLGDKPTGSYSKAWKAVREDKTWFINELTKYVRTCTSDIDREKLVALITIEVHALAIIHDLQKQMIPSHTHFEWQKQLRFELKISDQLADVKILQTNTSTSYGFEYQGNNGRLVVTNLTDRCYMTLTTAMKMYKGGSPQGPAGTGKTESVKDLGKGMGKFVLVFNCQEGLDYKSIGRLFSGLIQTGGWGCFDEFNRISVEVLSVVAEQMRQIMSALRSMGDDETNNKYTFESEVIQFNKNTGIFITMNPGYAGRSELPDNLKSLFRPMAMMVPDSQLIVEIMLQSEGFKFGKALAIKVDTLYKLMNQQLSKQDHYEFGLRSIKSVLNCAGKIRRDKGVEKPTEKEPEMEENIQETKILMKALRDMNMPKFIEQDIFLFNALINDLFPNIELADNQNPLFIETIENELKAQGLIPKPEFVTKIVQLYDSKNTRHGNMLVGQALTGKSTCWKILQRTMNHLNKVDPKRYPAVKTEILNPKAVTMDELFGWVDLKTLEWNDGVLSTMMDRLCRDEGADQQWMILDGPVDTLWIESMNTVLDDNKVLTLLNGDRIQLNNKVGLVFEVNDLSVASPATVSRAGMIYIDPQDIGVNFFLDAWVNKFEKDEWLVEFWYEMFDKWVDKMYKTRSQCKELVPCFDINIAQSLVRLLDSFMVNEHNRKYIGADIKDKNEIYRSLLEKWFVFSLIWSFGGAVDEQGRRVIDYSMRDIDAIFPTANTVYDYYINNEKNEWVSWEEKISNALWKPPQNTPYHKMLVPTVDTVRNRFVLNCLIENQIATLIVGNTGTGKTAIINGVLQDLPDQKYTYQNIVFSAQSSSLKTQDMIESKLVARTKSKMIADGKKMVIFIDDLNMPRKDEFGSQPPLELLRQWIDYNGWFDRTFRDIFKHILEVQLVAAMGPPGGGKAVISGRVQSKFNMINFTFPNDSQVKRIYQSILTYKFMEFDEEIKPLSETIAVATLKLFQQVSDSFLPTPQKSHYVFNMRDISKVIQGVFQINKFYCDDKKAVYRNWVHECLRVFHDRLIDFTDRSKIKQLIQEQLEQTLQTNMVDCTNEEEQDTIFIDFLEEANNVQIYTEVSYKDRIKMSEFINEKLVEYNRGKSPMDIVLFEDAISYVCKIHRIIKLGKGHGMLVGEGGSGRHSLTKLSAFIAGYNIWEISISKSYGMREFRDDIKKWCEQCGQQDKPGVFLFSDNQIVNEGFIEDINNILTVGEVPNLFSQKEDYPIIKDKTRKKYLKAHDLKKDARVADEDIIDYFFTKVQNNFHLMLCMSKTGDNLRKYCRMYPGLVNNTTIIWFLPWPEQALFEVSNKYLEKIVLKQKIVIELPKEEEEKKKKEGNEEEGEEQEDDLDEEEKDEETLAREEEERKKKEEEERLAKEEEEKGFDESELRELISKFFSFAHTRTADLAEEMQRELKRTYYITPSLYIELVKYYTKLLEEKYKEYQYEIKKLTLGLHKLYQANEKSKQIEIELQSIDIKLKKETKDTEALMVKIESENRDASIKQQQVEQKTLIVEKESATVSDLKAEADQELIAAQPALDQANEALDKLDNKSISEIKSFTSPPEGIMKVLSAVMHIKGKEANWPTAKKEMASPDFLKELKNPNVKDSISQRVLLKVEKFTHDPTMVLKNIENQSVAGAALWRWVLAMEAYAKAKKDVEPKKITVQKLTEKLNKFQEELIVLKTSFEELQQKIKGFQKKLEENEKIKQKLQEQAKVQKDKKERAEKLLDGLQGTQKGWKERKAVLESEYEFLIGNCLITAALMTYSGPFPSEKRQKLVKSLIQKVNSLKIQYQRGFSFAGFLAKQIEFLNWTFKGLPDDDFSKENAVLCMKGNRFALMIDPQLQANMWIRKTEEKRAKTLSSGKGLNRPNPIILDPQTPNYLRTLEEAIAFGYIVILQNIYEKLDPQLEPILNKNLKNVAGQQLLILGADKEIKYDPNFRLYMTTKLSNPKYKAEISTKVTLINFAVKEEGLEEQLTAVVIKKMEAALESSKNDLVQKKASNEQKLKDLDEQILKMLQESKGSLIDDIELINALQTNKETQIDIENQIEQGAKSMKKTLDARNNYIPLARLAAKLFFVINDFNLIDNMYQFSLESYISLFQNTIVMYQGKSTAVNDSLPEKLNQISTLHKLEVYKYACKGLFEKDKLLLSIQMAVALSKDIDQDEWNFFLRGSDAILDRKQQPPNPHPDWISNSSWDTICDLDKSDKMPSFAGLCGAFIHNTKEWKRWYSHPTPESEPLPGEWDTKCDVLRKMILIKTIRPDRVLFSAQIFVAEKLGPEFKNPPSYDLEDLYRSSDKLVPIIFILSTGTDPLSNLQQLANEKQIDLVQVSLGQGQEQKAKEKISEGGRNGNWLFLANCHLSLDFLKDLEKIIEMNEDNRNQIHENFRLWLSSAAHPNFPISILQKCIKQTSEPPKGLKANMIKLYNSMGGEKFNTTQIQNNTAQIAGYYKKALFGLTWFHAICIERKRFKNLGWNVIYDFNDSDWETADLILQMYIDKESDVKKDDKQQQQNLLMAPPGAEQTEPVKSPPWGAIQYLISEVTYGGRVTDDRDRKLLNVYAKEMFNNSVIMDDKHKFVENDGKYFVPDNQTLKELKANQQQNITEPKYYVKQIQEFPDVEKPEVFGQHLNAEISSFQIQSVELIHSIISLSPKVGSTEGKSRESVVQEIIKNLEEKMPMMFEMDDILSRVDVKDSSNPLKVVLIQEISRYDVLLRTLVKSLKELNRGIQGLVLISEEQEAIIDSLFNGQVPQAWLFCYPSLKPLNSWMDDLVLRCKQFYDWAYKGQPNIFWLPGFSFPTGFTTALTQQAARRYRYPVDGFTFEYICYQYDIHISMPSKEGAFVEGLFIEGAKWDGDKNCIAEPEPMKLSYKMPVILFKPVYNSKKSKQQLYDCPTYYYPVRTGTRERPSYMFNVQLPIKANPSLAPGQSDQDVWIKKGTALLLQLAE